MAFDRHVPLEGASNFRDFGGYAAADGRSVKWRRLFRSDRPPLATLIQILEKMLAPQLLASPDNADDAPVTDRDFVLDSALAVEFQ